MFRRLRFGIDLLRPWCGCRRRLRSLWGGGWIGLRSPRGSWNPRRRWRRLLTNGLAVVVADHHHDKFRLLRCDGLARNLRPFRVAAEIISYEPRLGPMLAHDANLWLFRIGIF